MRRLYCVESTWLIDDGKKGLIFELGYWQHLNLLKIQNLINIFGEPILVYE